MPTYLDTVTRIQTDCLNRTDFSDTVKRAIQTTIRHYERQRFWFNETSTLLTCVVNTETVAVPANMLGAPDLLQVRQNGNDTELAVEPFDTIRAINVNNTSGLPVMYAKRHDSFYLANVPNSAYPLPCFYLKKLPALSADTDTNDWLSAAEDLIVWGTAKLVWATTIRNISAANVCAGLESDAIKELRRYAEQHQSNKITPTRF